MTDRPDNVQHKDTVHKNVAGLRKLYDCSTYLYLKVEILWHFYKCTFKPNDCIFSNKTILSAENNNYKIAEVLDPQKMCLPKVLDLSHVWDGHTWTETHTD